MSTPSPIDDAALHVALEKYFQYPAFRPGQLDALHHVLSERDTLVVMPTGSGKSLIYQLAALVRDGTALVISPLVALMKDQADSLTRRGIAATYINSSLTVAEQNKRLEALAQQQYKIVLVAPERLRSGAFRGALKRAALSLLAIDEAHCLSQWGHDFRPDYLHLAEMRREFKPPVTLALTATATLRVQDDIIKLLELQNAERLVTGFNRPNLYLEVLYAPDVKTKLALTREFLSNIEGAGIIYAGTRRDTEEVADFVRQICRDGVGRHLPAAHYHAGVDNETRHDVQDKFLAGDLPLVVATNAFGMGIDRPDVRFVLHYTMPGTLEAYYQEAGRAGRDGLAARATLIFSPKDTALHESFIANDSPTLDQLRALHQYLQTHPQTNTVAIEASIGLRDVTARVALEQLEAARLLYREPFDDFGMMRVKVAPLNEGLLRQIAAQVQARQEHKRRLLGKIVSYAETNACRRRVILDYFGDHGTADAPMCCDNDAARAEIASGDTERRARNDIATTETEHIALTVLDAAQAFQRKIGKGKLADILKGSKAKDVQPFVKSPHYAKLEALRKYELEALIQQLFDDNYLKQVGGEYPVIALTPRGEHALKTRAAIQTNIRPPAPGAAEKARAEKEAGGTVLLTAQLLAQGKSPEQIAAERGLVAGTIYSHLAQLILQGQVDVNRVVPQPLQNQIRAAINAVGSAQYLAPIKARLPEEIDYNVIRCVANAWLREQGQIQPPPSPQEDRAGRVHAMGESGNLIHVPELIAALQDENGNVRRLAASALGKLKAQAAVEPLLALLETEQGPQVRQYAIKALGAIGDLRAKSKLEQIARDLNEMYYNRDSAVAALKNLGKQKLQSTNAPVPQSPISSPQSPSPNPPSPISNPHSPAPTIDDFLAQPHARVLAGPWRAGWALDFHSRFDGDTQNRGVIGDLVFRYKYRDEHHLARELAGRWAQLLSAHRELPKPDAVLPIPSTTPRDFDPVGALAQALASELQVPALFGVLVKTRATQPQKEMTSLAQKQANVRGAFALRGDLRGKHILLVDDLYDSGATLQEAARVLQRGGVASIVVLTLTKTIHSDR